MNKKFISVSHQDIVDLHRWLLSAESLVSPEFDLETVHQSIHDGDYEYAGFKLLDLAHLHNALEKIEKLKIKQESEEGKNEKEKVDKKDDRKLIDIAKDFVNGTKAV